VLVDTFPPAPPKALKAISSEGAINLIWEPNTEKDFAGYIVFRGVEPAGDATAASRPSRSSSRRSGTVSSRASRLCMPCRAVDRAGNTSDPVAAPSWKQHDDEALSPQLPQS
jgi:hypothetical protein